MAAYVTHKMLEMHSEQMLNAMSEVAVQTGMALGIAIPHIVTAIQEGNPNAALAKLKAEEIDLELIGQTMASVVMANIRRALEAHAQP